MSNDRLIAGGLRRKHSSPPGRLRRGPEHGLRACLQAPGSAEPADTDESTTLDSLRESAGELATEAERFCRRGP